ncbi:MAG: class I SAM-dependent methyltransferase [Fusobacteria bacterium]|nr:class I SAM-dependent methyltransferase [Fusobacteriota bacterium]
MMYQKFASVYDKFMQDRMNYYGWACFTENMFQMYDVEKSDNIADVGCGTGSFLKHMKRFGYKNMVGVDSSPEMLEVLNGKFKESKVVETRLLDMKEWSEPKTYKGITSYFDVVNYLANEEEVERFFRSVHTNLVKKGVFIFDLFDHSVLEEVFENNLVHEAREGWSVTWECIEKENQFDVITTVKFADDSTNYVEKHQKYLYSEERIEKLLKKVGFTVSRVCEPSIAESRDFFIAIKE